jgi:hypothetical protein
MRSISLHFYKSILEWAAVLMVGFAVVIPILIVSVISAPTWTDLILTSGDAVQTLTAALANAAFCALVSSLFGLLLTWIILLTSSTGAVMFLILTTLFFPGIVSGLGFDYGLHYVLMASNSILFWKACALLVAITGYIIPYQLVAGLWFLNGIPRQERQAASEFFGVGGMKAKYWLTRLSGPSLMVFMIGFAMALTEVPRSHYLGIDLFGLGRQYFGPWTASRFNSVGIVSGVFPFVTIFCGLAAVITAYSSSRR